MGLTHLSEIFDRLSPNLRTYRTEDSTRPLYDLPDHPLPPADTPAPIRFLPAYDNIYLSHATRTRILPDSARPHIFTNNGIIKPTVLIDGYPTATWTTTQSATTATLTLTPIAPIPGSARPHLETEAQAVLAFLAPNAAATIRFSDQA